MNEKDNEQQRGPEPTPEAELPAQDVAQPTPEVAPQETSANDEIAGRQSDAAPESDAAEHAESEAQPTDEGDAAADTQPDTQPDTDGDVDSGGDGEAEEGEDEAESADEQADDADDDTPDKHSRYVVGVRMQRAGPVEYFWARHLELAPGVNVVVEAERGLAVGHCVTSRIPHEPQKGDRQIHNVVRIADDRDSLIIQENETRNREALTICREMIEELRLPMRLIQVDYQHSANKATFYFSAEGRVDFRELVRKLAQQLKIRVEMRQIGIRDEAKLIGGLGPCGQPVCCATFLVDFAPVSIRQAKEQNLTLNPEKVSGLCGRLMCCLGYESDTYRGEQKGLPKIGKKADTWKGRGRVLEINIFSRQMRLQLDTREYISISIDDFRAFKEDPDGFTKVVEQREEAERQAAIDKLNISRDTSRISRGGGRGKPSGPPKGRSASPRSGGSRGPQRNNDGGPNKSGKPQSESESARPQAAPGENKPGDDNKQDEAPKRKRRSRGGRRRNKNKGPGGTPSDGGPDASQRSGDAPAKGADGSGGRPQQGDGNKPAGSGHRRGGRKRGGRGRSEGPAPEGSAQGGAPKEGGGKRPARPRSEGDNRAPRTRSGGDGQPARSRTGADGRPSRTRPGGDNPAPAGKPARSRSGRGDENS